MYRCSIRERLTEKLHNCNGFFTTHRYPSFLKFRQRQRILPNFRQRREAFINTDTRRFKIQTSDMGPPPPPLAGPPPWHDSFHAVGFILMLVNLPLVLGMHISSILQQIFHYCNSVVTSSKMKRGAVSSCEISAVYSLGCTWWFLWWNTKLFRFHHSWLVPIRINFIDENIINGFH